MLCPRCHGTHVVVEDGTRRPCPECGGLGEIHCCDGLQEQLDPPPPPPAKSGVARPADPGP